MSPQPNFDKFKPSNRQFEFREYPFYWIMRVANRYNQTIEGQLKPIKMTTTSWRVGLILRETGAISMTEIADHAVGRLPTITKTVYKMQDQGLVTVSQNKTDGRATVVEITNLGLETIDQMTRGTAKTVDQSFDGLSREDIETLNRLLQKMFNNLSR